MDTDAQLWVEQTQVSVGNVDHLHVRFAVELQDPSVQRAPPGLLLFMIAAWVIVAFRVWSEYHKPQSLRVAAFPRNQQAQRWLAGLLLPLVSVVT